MVFETERLYVRKMTQNDFRDLCEILQDKDVMYAHEHAFSNKEVQTWLDKQLERYSKLGFGLWAVIHKKTDKFLGQAGLTMQDCEGEQLLEIGYLFKKAYWHKGYASEITIGCREYAFHTLERNEVYSIIRDNNISSQRVAEKCGMEIMKTFLKHYYNMDMPHYVFHVQKLNS